MFERRFSIVLCVLVSIVAIAESDDSLASNNNLFNVSDSLTIRLPARPPFSFGFGFGAVIISGELKKPEPVYDRYYVESGLAYLLSACVPITKSQFIGFNASYLYFETAMDNKASGGVFRDNESEWLQFDPNDQYGVKDVFDNTLVYTEFFSGNSMYELSAFTFGTSFWIPFGKSNRVRLAIEPNFGKGKLVFGELERTIEETVLVRTGSDVLRLVTFETDDKVFIRGLSLSLVLFPSKRFFLRFGCNYTATSTAFFDLKTQLYVNKVFKAGFSEKYSTSFSGYILSINAGVAF